MGAWSIFGFVLFVTASIVTNSFWMIATLLGVFALILLAIKIEDIQQGRSHW